jgi:hypothetical protein
MTNNVTTVTVKNRLGNKFGYLDVRVNTSPNQISTNNDMISAGDEMVVYPFDQSSSLQLESIDIEVLGQEDEIPIPIGIDFMVDLNVEASLVSYENKWTIIFDPPITPGTGSKGGDSNVNVTIGQDESDYLSVLMLAILIALIVGALSSAISPLLSVFAVGATLVVAVGAWIKSAGRKRKKRKVNPGESIK